MLHNTKHIPSISEQIGDEKIETKNINNIPNVIANSQGYDADAWIKKVHANQIKELDLSTKKTRDITKDSTLRRDYELPVNISNDGELATYHSSMLSDRISSLVDAKNRVWHSSEHYANSVEFSLDRDSKIKFICLSKGKYAVYSDLSLRIYGASVYKDILIDDIITNTGGDAFRPLDIKMSVASPVRTMVALPDGRLLCLSEDGKIYAWNIKQAELIGNALHGFPTETESHYSITIWSGDADNVSSFLLLPNNRIAIASDVIQIWDSSTDKYLFEINTQSSGNKDLKIIDALALINSKWLASSFDHEIRLWNLETNERSDEFLGHTSSINSITDLKNGCFASGSTDGTIRIWSHINQTCEMVIVGEKNYPITFVGTLKDGSLISQHSQQSNNKIKNTLILRSFDMRHLEIRDIKDLLIALKDNKSVETLNLSNMKIMDADITPSLIFKDKPLVTLLKKNYFIKELDLRNTKITAAGITKIQNILKKLPNRPQLTLRHESLSEQAPPPPDETKAIYAVNTPEDTILDSNFLLTLQKKSLVLFNVIHKECKTVQAENERQIILKNDILRDYYYVFLCQFSDIWLACKTIHSGMVKNSQMNTIDYFLVALDKGAQYASFPGIALLKDILTAGVFFLNERDKTKAVNYMATYFDTVINADIFIEEMGRQLTLALRNKILALNLNQSFFHRTMNVIKRTKNYITTNDIDSQIKECAAEDCKKIIIAIMQNKIPAKPTLADIDNILSETIGSEYKTSRTLQKTPNSTSSSSAQIHHQLLSSSTTNNTSINEESYESVINLKIKVESLEKKIELLEIKKQQSPKSPDTDQTQLQLEAISLTIEGDNPSLSTPPPNNATLYQRSLEARIADLEKYVSSVSLYVMQDAESRGISGPKHTRQASPEETENHQNVMNQLRSKKW